MHTKLLTAAAANTAAAVQEVDDEQLAVESGSASD
jgi:hypothetical protein